MAWAGKGSGRGGRPWRRKRARVLAKDDGLCRTCRRKGRVTVATQVDHVVALAEGGTDDEGNLASICDDCHEAKTLAESKRARGLPVTVPGADAEGMPIDPNHPWNAGPK
jgi:5-methylcytosine-specific restriction protein A